MAKQQYTFLTQERIDYLKSLGWSNEKIKNFAFMVQSEGGPRSENLTYTTAERMAEVFKYNKFFAGLNTEQRIQKINEYGLLRNPELTGNTFYGQRLGNQGGNDGFMFRGRGHLQITGRSNYDAVGKKIKIDLIKDPDILERDEEIGFKASAAFVDLNERNNAGSTLQGMYGIVKPATSLDESRKRVRMLTDSEMMETARRNSASRAAMRFDDKKEEKVVINDEISASRSVPVPEMPDPNRDAMNKGMISIQTYMEKRMREEGLK